MAITVNSIPGSVAFAASPMVIKAHTNLTGKTFLRIIADVSVVASSGTGPYIHNESYTYSVAGDGNATFNIAESVQAALNACTYCSITASSVVQYAAVAVYSVVLREVFLDKMIEVEGDVKNVVNSFTAVMGGLTDYELMAKPAWENADVFIGSGAVLSRKPENEVIYGGHPLVLPVVCNKSQSVSVTAASFPGEAAESEVGSDTVTAYIPKSISVPVGQQDGCCRYKLTPSARQWSSKKFLRRSDPGKHASFLFLNGFGVLESITCLTREVRGYEVKAETYTESARVGERVSSVINLSGVPYISIQLTSGLVSREWADWFASEFIPSRRVWMLLGGKYLPVAIEADGNIKLYDSSKPDLCEVKFTARCVLRGSVVSVAR